MAIQERIANEKSKQERLANENEGQEKIAKESGKEKHSMNKSEHGGIRKKGKFKKLKKKVHHLFNPHDSSSESSSDSSSDTDDETKHEDTRRREKQERYTKIEETYIQNWDPTVKVSGKSDELADRDGDRVDVMDSVNERDEGMEKLISSSNNLTQVLEDIPDNVETHVMNKEVAEEERKERERETAELEKEQIVGKLIDKFSTMQEDKFQPVSRNNSLREGDHIETESKVSLLTEKFGSYKEVYLEENHPEKMESHTSRRDSDVKTLIGMFKKTFTHPESGECEENDTNANVQKVDPPRMTTKDMPGKYRKLNADELKFFTTGGLSADQFARSQSLRVKKTETPALQPRAGSMREKKSDQHPECRQLRPDELQYFSGKMNNIYPTTLNNSNNSGQDFRISSQGCLLDNDQNRHPGDDQYKNDGHSSDSDSNPSILRDDDYGQEVSDEALLMPEYLYTKSLTELYTDDENDEAYEYNQSIFDISSSLDANITSEYNVTMQGLSISLPHKDSSFEYGANVSMESADKSEEESESLLRGEITQTKISNICDSDKYCPEDKLHLADVSKGVCENKMAEKNSKTPPSKIDNSQETTDNMPNDFDVKDLSSPLDGEVQSSNTNASMVHSTEEDTTKTKDIEDYYLILDENKEYLSSKEFGIFCFLVALLSLVVYFIGIQFSTT
ncbi:hypothetical protein SK128_020424 [Halocaridina rubra]|uniref:Uncharacterized protein n=1 Tax=Halocaridina rubra TaxID=373956 RepID=A0AAN8ZRN2_HALRR